jgi:hypothetical protein
MGFIAMPNAMLQNKTKHKYKHFVLLYTPHESERQEFYAAFIHCPFLVKASTWDVSERLNE